MRLICVSNTAWSVFHFRRDLLLSFQSSGYDITVIASEDAYSQRLTALGFEVLSVALDARGVNPWRDWQYMRELRQLYRKIQPDVLLQFTIKPVIYGSFAYRGLAGLTINTITGLGSAFLGSRLLKHWVGWLYRWSQRGVDKVFFQNREDMALFQQQGWLPAERCVYVPGSGVKLELFKPVPLPLQQPFTFLLIGRLLPEKGYIEYITAIQQLKVALPELRFAILGKRELCGSHGISQAKLNGWVTAGWVEDWGETDDVREAIAKVHCVVLPSYREGLPRSLLEASAMQRPVIASDVPGCREVVVDGETGLLCKVKDADDLAQKMNIMVQLSQAQRQHMGEAGRAHVVKHFSLTKVIVCYRQYVVSTGIKQ